MYIMIVEDDYALSRLYEKVLVNKGYRLSHFTNLKECFANLFSFNPDVLVVDWRLDDGTAAPLLDYLMDLDPLFRPKVVIASAEITSHELTQYRPVIDRFLRKPVMTQDLVEAVSGLADQAAISRLPFQAIEAEPINDIVIKLKWLGLITPDLVENHTELGDPHTLIFDLRDLSFSRFNLNAFDRDGHRIPSAPQQVLTVHRDGDEGNAFFLTDFFLKGIPSYFYTDLDHALSDALLP